MQTRRRTKNVQAEAQAEAQARLWPLAPGWPGPATDLVLAKLPRGTKRCVRATCRAARAAVVDATTHQLDLGAEADCFAAAVPRMARLESLGFSCVTQGDCSAVAAALAQLPPSVGKLKVATSLPPASGLAAALTAATHLRALDLAAAGDDAVCRAYLDVFRQLPRLTSAKISLNLACVNWKKPVPVLALPFAHLQELSLCDTGCGQLLPHLFDAGGGGGLPALRALNLSYPSSLDLSHLWAAPWLSQLTRLRVSARFCGEGNSLPPPGGAAPALQELELFTGFGGNEAFTAAHARRLADYGLPALRALTLGFPGYGARPGDGAVEALVAAPWVSGLQSLELRCACRYVNGGWCGPAGGAALAAAPLHALTRLVLLGDPELDVPSLTALLAAPWAASLQSLRLGSQKLVSGASGDAALSALVAAHLPQLQECVFSSAGLTPATIGILGTAPWIPQLTRLVLDSNQDLGEAGMRALAHFNLPRIEELSVVGCCTQFPSLLPVVRTAPWFRQLARFWFGGAAAKRWQWCGVQFMAYDGVGPLADAWARGTELEAVEWPDEGADWSDGMRVYDGDDSEYLGE